MKYLIYLIAILMTLKAEAQSVNQTDDKPIDFTGNFDLYYKTDDSNRIRTPGRVFDARNNVMQVNLAELSAKKTKGPIQFRADFAFGEMVDTLMGVDPSAAVGTANADASKNITQAFITYNTSEIKDLTISAGKFYSYLGFEVTRAKDNWNYSRSYTYNYGIPFWHEGLSLGYGFIPTKLSGTFYVMNAWDGRIANEQNKSATLGASLNWAPMEGAILVFNYISGAEGTESGSIRSVSELNGSYAINDFASVAFDTVVGRQTSTATTTESKWNSYVIYAKLNFTPFYTLSPRYEVYDDADGFTLGQGTTQKITSITLSNNFNLEQGLEARIEIRNDKSNAVSTNNHTTTTVAFLYSF